MLNLKIWLYRIYEVLIPYFLFFLPLTNRYLIHLLLLNKHIRAENSPLSQDLKLQALEWSLKLSLTLMIWFDLPRQLRSLGSRLFKGRQESLLNLRNVIIEGLWVISIRILGG